MKALILSDLHNEFGVKCQVPRDLVFDVVILAGDIDIGSAGAEWALGQFGASDIPIIYVAGNHEYYGKTYHKVNRQLRFLDDENENFHFLDGSDKPSVTIDGVCFIGATLWTDFKLGASAEPYPYTQSKAMINGLAMMNDYRVVTYCDTITGTFRKLMPANTLEFHNEELRAIVSELSSKKNAESTKVVVTHHAPSPKSIHDDFKDEWLSNPFYASNLDNIIETLEPDVWIHGHMHDAADYNIGVTRVVSNPRGYVSRDFREKNVEDQFLIIDL